jgi:hypothetical protein
MAPSDNNVVWESGPSLTLGDEADEFVVHDIPIGAKYRGWRRKNDAKWKVQGKASVTVNYVEANSKKEIAQNFEHESKNNGSVKGGAKLVVAEVLEGLNVGLEGKIKKDRTRIKRADANTYFSHRAIVVHGRTQTGYFSASSKIDIQVEIGLEYEKEIYRVLNKFLRPQVLIAFAALAIAVATMMWWKSSQEQLDWWQTIVSGIGQGIVKAGNAISTYI